MPSIYLITAHNSRERVHTLLRYIYSESNSYIIHFDPKSPAELQREIQFLQKVFHNIFVLTPRAYSWAGISQVKTTVAAIDCALSLKLEWGHFITISEQDFPLHNPDVINASLLEHHSYITTTPFVDMSDVEKEDIRNRFAWHYRELPGVGSFAVSPRENLNEVLGKVSHGSNWMVLSRKHCLDIIRLWNNQNYNSLFSDSLHADETAIQSLLRLSENSERLIMPTKTYIAWPHISGNEDMTFTEENYRSALNENFFFIRKRPDKIPYFVLSNLDQSNHFQRKYKKNLLPSAPAMDLRDNSSLRQRAQELCKIFSERYTKVEFLGGKNLVNTPNFYAILKTEYMDDLISIVVISSDLETFKIIVHYNKYSEGFSSIKVFGYEAIPLRVRVYGLFFTFEIVPPNDATRGFVSLPLNSRDISDLFAKIDQNLSFANGLNVPASPKK